MPSFRISITASRRAAARFVTGVRRKILQALEEENERTGLKQTDIARTIGVHRSVINRELRGKKDITLGRVAELASAMGRVPVLEFPAIGTNLHGVLPTTSTNSDFDFRKLLEAIPETSRPSYDVTFTVAGNDNFTPVPEVISL